MRLFAVSLLSLFGTTAFAQSGEVVVEQAGDGNVVSVLQTASFARIVQAGTENGARIDQTGGSTAEVVQTGTGNVLAGLDAARLGPDPLSAAFQSDESQLLLSQTGTGNVALVEQSAGAYASITQTGNHNTVTLLQSGVNP